MDIERRDWMKEYFHLFRNRQKDIEQEENIEDCYQDTC